jgi:small basic protein
MFENPDEVTGLDGTGIQCTCVFCQARFFLEIIATKAVLLSMKLGIKIILHGMFQFGFPISL